MIELNEIDTDYHKITHNKIPKFLVTPFST